MTAKKGCLLAAAGAVVIAAVLVLVVFWLTGDAVKSAGDFLSLLGEGQTEAAYESASKHFQAQTDFTAFEAFVQQTGLNRFSSASWTSRSVENNQARLEGSIETSDGGTTLLTMELVKEDGDWKVLSISGPAAGVATTGSAKPLPPDTELGRLVQRTLAEFKSAVDAGDFAAFHASVSNMWKNQSTPEDLRSAFQSLIDQNVDLGAAEGDPSFSEAPAIDGNGILHLKGYFTAAGSQNLNFELKYIYEHPEWKLFGIHVSIGQAAESENREAASPAAEPGDPSSAPSEEPGSAASGLPSSPEEAWVIQENPALSGRLGRLLVYFPADTATGGAKIEAFRPGEEAAAVTSYGRMEADLLPGRYEVVVSGQRVSGVEVVSAGDTRLRAGVLRVRVGSGTKIVVHGRAVGESQTQPIATAYGNTDFGLPVGTYEVEIAGQKDVATVADGQITEF